MEERMLSGEPTLSMAVGLLTPNLLRGATINCTGTSVMEAQVLRTPLLRL